MFGETLGSYLARDKAPSILNGTSGERAPISITEIHGGRPDAVVTGITKIETCEECSGAGYVHEDAETAYRCPACKGTGRNAEKAAKPVLGAVTVDDEEWWAA